MRPQARGVLGWRAIARSYRHAPNTCPLIPAAERPARPSEDFAHIDSMTGVESRPDREYPALDAVSADLPNDRGMAAVRLRAC